MFLAELQLALQLAYVCPILGFPDHNNSPALADPGTDSASFAKGIVYLDLPIKLEDDAFGTAKIAVKASRAILFIQNGFFRSPTGVLRDQMSGLIARSDWIFGDMNRSLIFRDGRPVHIRSSKTRL
jgi:hypothetical protein